MPSRWRALTLAGLLFAAIGLAPIAAEATWRQELRCPPHRYHPKSWKRAYHPHDRWYCEYDRYRRHHDCYVSGGRHRKWHRGGYHDRCDNRDRCDNDDDYGWDDD